MGPPEEARPLDPIPIMMHQLNKPEFICRPSSLLRRLSMIWRKPRPIEDVHLPWGLSLRVRPSETIGRQVYTFGLFDLIVCEALFRLTTPGDMALDVGANIGQMTGLLAKRSGPGGSVWAFEPHPDVRNDLLDHIMKWQRCPPIAPILVRPEALAEKDGEGELFEPDCFESNRGLASLGSRGPGGRRLPIVLNRLDAVVPSEQPIGILKMDVEGAEERVLSGASGLLEGRQIRDIIFEDQGPYPSAVARFLESKGYQVYSLGLRISGLQVRKETRASEFLRPWDSPSFLATAEPERAVSLLRPTGWRCLSGS